MGKPKASSGSGSAPAYAKDDISASRSEYLFPIPWPLDQLLLPTLNDARDSPMLHLLFNISATTVPAACLMYKSCNSHWVGLAYLIANYVLYVQRFMLTLHFTEHRRLFKSSEWGICEDAMRQNLVKPGSYDAATVTHSVSSDSDTSCCLELQAISKHVLRTIVCRHIPLLLKPRKVCRHKHCLLLTDLYFCL